MPYPDDKHMIIGFISNLLFSTRVEAAAQSLGYQMLWIESARQVAPGDEQEPEHRVFGEPLGGQAGALIEFITRAHPALLIFDLENQAIPWREWVALIKSVPATRRIPVICFGPHVNVEQLKDASARGADAAMPRSRFLNTLPDVISRYAKVPDQSEIAAKCLQPLSELAIRGLELFNAGEYFEAHEVLEHAWNLETGIGRELYRAVLQIAVAYLQIERNNYKGAMKMFLRSRQWIDPLPDICRGVNILQLRNDAREMYRELERLGPKRIHEITPDQFKPVIYSL